MPPVHPPPPPPLQASSTLADMLYNTQQYPESYQAVSIAIEAALAAGDHPTYIKLCNNAGAVLKKMGQ